MCVCVGAEHDQVNPGAGPADTEGFTVRGQNGRPAQRLGNKIPTSGGNAQTKPRQAIQGTPQNPSLTCMCCMHK